ncbi:hypothetical protein BC936DRAFT_146476 [Jimgerdemannia flammicorona]|uniref:Uncharacterized protein n=1 Tax=Jimgerdemannia flammicorona TaxID=994334 RepID=A0A433D7J8_9FUNG|nr:hypothetical protein BC936DRAFT_146476 [Jimgerdemannia flammicorona]
MRSGLGCGTGHDAKRRRNHERLPIVVLHERNTNLPLQPFAFPSQPWLHPIQPAAPFSASPSLPLPPAFASSASPTAPVPPVPPSLSSLRPAFSLSLAFPSPLRSLLPPPHPRFPVRASWPSHAASRAAGSTALPSRSAAQSPVAPMRSGRPAPRLRSPAPASAVWLPRASARRRVGGSAPPVRPRGAALERPIQRRRVFRARAGRRRQSTKKWVWRSGMVRCHEPFGRR